MSMTSIATRPRTEAGKARVRFNALQHGLCAANVSLPFEYTAEFERRRCEYVAYFQPANLIEWDLVEAPIAARELIDESNSLRQLNEIRLDRPPVSDSPEAVIESDTYPQSEILPNETIPKNEHPEFPPLGNATTEPTTDAVPTPDPRELTTDHRPLTTFC